MKLTLLMLLTILISCGAPEIGDRERCIYDYDLDVCLCRTFETTMHHIGQKPNTELVKHEGRYCNRMIGFRPKEWQEYYLDQERLRLWLKDKTKTRKVKKIIKKI